MAGTTPDFIVPLARILYAAVFLFSAPGHFTWETIEYAGGHGVPFARAAVPLSGMLALFGGLSVVFGYRARGGAWLLVLFLVPVTIMMHDFWARDGAEAQREQIAFMKNLSLLGGALLIAYFGAGPMSLDARRERAREREPMRRPSP